jgi:hypothetical protein
MRAQPLPAARMHDPDEEALLFVAKMMGKARVAKGVAKIAAGLLAGAATRASEEILASRVGRVVHVARVAAHAATHVATQRAHAVAQSMAPSEDEPAAEEHDECKSCVDVA